MDPSIEVWVKMTSDQEVERARIVLGIARMWLQGFGAAAILLAGISTLWMAFTFPEYFGIIVAMTIGIVAAMLGIPLILGWLMSKLGISFNLFRLPE